MGYPQKIKLHLQWQKIIEHVQGIICFYNDQSFLDKGELLEDVIINLINVYQRDPWPQPTLLL